MVSQGAIKSNQIDWTTMPPPMNQWTSVSGTNIEVVSGQWLLPDEYEYSENIIRLPCWMPKGFGFRVMGKNWAVKLNTPQQRDHLLDYKYFYKEYGYILGGDPLYIEEVMPILENDAGALLPVLDVEYGDMYASYGYTFRPEIYEFVCTEDNILDVVFGRQSSAPKARLVYGYGYGYCYGYGPPPINTNTNITITISDYMTPNSEQIIHGSNKQHSKIFVSKKWNRSRRT